MSAPGHVCNGGHGCAGADCACPCHFESKGERRRRRKASRLEGRPWSVEGGRVVYERSAAEERRHERSMERYARRIDVDPDWR